MKKIVIILVILGVLMPASSLILGNMISNFAETVIKTKAEITNVTQGGTRKRKTYNADFVFVTEDGKKISASGRTPRVSVGGVIAVYYDALNPHNIRVENGFITTTMFLLWGAGLTMLLLAFKLVIDIRAIQKRKKTLMLNGSYVNADVIKVSGKIPFIDSILDTFDCSLRKLTLQYFDDGVEYRIKSHSLALNSELPAPQRVRVYIDSNNRNVYYVDEDTIYQGN